MDDSILLWISAGIMATPLVAATLAELAEYVWSQPMRVYVLKEYIKEVGWMMYLWITAVILFIAGVTTDMFGVEIGPGLRALLWVATLTGLIAIPLIAFGRACKQRDTLAQQLVPKLQILNVFQVHNVILPNLKHRFVCEQLMGLYRLRIHNPGSGATVRKAKLVLEQILPTDGVSVSIPFISAIDNSLDHANSLEGVDIHPGATHEFDFLYLDVSTMGQAHFAFAAQGMNHIYPSHPHKLTLTVHGENIAATHRQMTLRQDENGQILCD